MAAMVYQYPKCSTCRTALKWLDEHEVEYQKTDLVASPPSVATLRDLHQRSGLPITRLFNTSGESYRLGKFKEKLKSMSQAEALAALAKDGKLIKRPILDNGRTVVVGFDEKAYTAASRRKT
ncbi:MAG TPA: arsenate reductase family protein [Polyangia bacterium]|jgi:arsenate reductase